MFLQQQAQGVGNARCHSILLPVRNLLARPPRRHDGKQERGTLRLRREFDFAVVFVTLGATATAFGQAFRQALPVLTPIAGVLIIAMGLHFIGVYRIGLLDRQLRHHGPGVASGPLGGFLLGLAFAIGWTPCIGPVLAAVLSVAASRDTAWEGAGLLGLYSLGLGVPFFLAGIAIGPFMAFFQGFKRHLHTVERVMGVLLVVTGVLFLTGNFTRLSYWFLETFPVLANFG